MNTDSIIVFESLAVEMINASVQVLAMEIQNQF